MTRFCLMYTQAYNTPKPVDRGGPEQPAMSSSETDSAVCVSRYYNKYIYIYINAQ